MLVIACAIAPFPLAAQQSADEDAPEQQTRQAQAVSRAVYETFEKAQLLADEEKYSEARTLLTNLIAKNKLSDYELVNAYQYLGFIVHSQDDTPTAIEIFEKILTVDAVEPQLRKRTLFTLSQLYTVVEDYETALSRIATWFSSEPNPAPNAYILKAQILYELNRYDEMIAPIESALAVAADRGIERKEDWYALLSFAYFQQGDFAKIVEINKILLANWPRKKYWLYLANAYRELEDEDNFATAYDCAYLLGFLESESELLTLAQLYMQADAPYKAATLIAAEMADGRIAKTAKNYRLLSQAWMLAQEDARAIEPLRIAAEIEESGDLMIRLANAHSSLRQAKQCVDAARTGIDKGKLKSPDYAYMTLGTCLYNSAEYHAAQRAFREAAEFDRTESQARAWLRAVDLDIRRQEQIALVEAQTREHVSAIEARRNARSNL